MPPSERPRFPGGGRYRRLGATLRERFGERVHKVTLRGGFGCPNRDGRIGTGGCTFCSAEALVPEHGPVHGPVEDQLEAGLDVIRSLYGANLAIAYFQEGSSTDAPLAKLETLFRTAAEHERVVALAIGTRPDCLDQEVIGLLSELAARKPVWLELGLQTANDHILKAVNRGHGVAAFEDAARRGREAGLEVIAHVILDLPGETADDRRATAACLNQMGVNGVKIHNLHVLDETPLAHQYRAGDLRLASLAEYAEMASDFLEHLGPGVVVHRLTGGGPEALMLAPGWGRDKRRVLAAIEKRLGTQNAWQGKNAADPPLDID